MADLHNAAIAAGAKVVMPTDPEWSRRVAVDVVAALAADPNVRDLMTNLIDWTLLEWLGEDIDETRDWSTPEHLTDAILRALGGDTERTPA